MVDMVVIDARRLSCWLYFHTSVTKLLMLPARIDGRALLVVLLRKIFSAKASTVSIPPISWLPRVSFAPATGIPMTLPEFSPIPLSQVVVSFFSSSERRRYANSAFATLRAPPVNKSSESVPRVSPVLELIIDSRSLISFQFDQLTWNQRLPCQLCVPS